MQQLYFYRQHFISGVCRVVDHRAPSKDGVTILGKDGKPAKVYWRFSPNDNGKWFTPNDYKFVLENNPHCCWKNELQYQKSLDELEQIRIRNNKQKADEREKQLEEEAAATGDDDDLVKFRKERKRFKR